jgi:hypothetical protein
MRHDPRLAGPVGGISETAGPRASLRFGPVAQWIEQRFFEIADFRAELW